MLLALNRPTHHYQCTDFVQFVVNTGSGVSILAARTWRKWGRAEHRSVLVRSTCLYFWATVCEIASGPGDQAKWEGTPGGRGPGWERVLGWRGHRRE